MFDDAFGMATQCAESFRDNLRDSFGASMIADVLDPILREIDSLRNFNEEFLRQTLNIDRVLEEARSIQLRNGGRM